MQIPVINYIKENYNFDFVDMITEPGIDKVFYENNSDIINSIVNKIKISVEKHGSNVIFIAGHYDCAGNNVDDETHRKHIGESVKNIKLKFPFLKVIGLWVNNNWEVEKVSEL